MHYIIYVCLSILSVIYLSFNVSCVITPPLPGREIERRAKQAVHHLISPQQTDVSSVLPCTQLFLVLLFIISFPEPSAGHAP